MTEPQDLQHRLAKAFGIAPPAEDAPRPDASARKTESDPAPEKKGLLRSVLPRHRALLAVSGSILVLIAALLLALNAPDGTLMATFFMVGLGMPMLALGLFVGAPQPLPATGDDGSTGQPNQLADIHDALGDMTVTRSADGTIITANNTFREITGCERPEGQTCETLGIIFNPGVVRGSFDVEIRSGTKSRIFLWHDVREVDPRTGAVVIQSIARDVTDERLMAAEREAARRHAEEESDLKSRLIATVSHEIRTPLSGLLGMGHLMANTSLNAEQRNYLDGIRESGTALAQLVEDLLDYSTLTAGRFRLRPQSVAVRPLVEGMVELMASRAHAKGIEIGAVIGPDISEQLTIDAARFRQVLYNVIGNAIKFTEKGGVLIEVGFEGAMLAITVRDSGPGMNEGELRRIFDAFEQGDLSRAREGGVGLGLAISVRILSEAGGSLSVTSDLGKGSTFTIRIPIDEETKPMRSGSELAQSQILLLAPEGPAAEALARTLNQLGATVSLHRTIAPTDFEQEGFGAFTDIIVDHRLDADFQAHLSARVVGPKTIYLVNPESRPEIMSGTHYHSWLIRPLREQTLIDVLTGKFKGLERRANEHEEFPVLAAEARDETDKEGASGKTETGLSILIGEDDPVNAMIARAALQKAGHHVRLADTFTKLGALYADATPDILLTDYTMPDGNSARFIADLRKAESREKTSPVPVIVLTADKSEETRRLLLRGGADLVLIKPATPDLLDRAITQILEKRHHAA